MLEITSSIHIPESEIELDFIRADGPGGQNVNKVATAVQLRFDLTNSPSLPEEVKTRLIKLAGKRVTQDGILVIEAKRFRSQERNRVDALERFRELVEKAIKMPKKRRKTKPPKSSQEDRLKDKKNRGNIKQFRAKHSFNQD